MKRKEKFLLTFLLVGVLGGLAGLGVFGAFTSTTSNSNNSFASGTVVIGDNDANSALYSVSNAKPGTTTSGCIKLTYTGSLASDVRIYTTSTIGALGQYVDLSITPGTQTGSPAFPSCTGFTADSGGAIYSGTLQNFATTKNSYANGVVDYPGASATSWVTNDAVVYQFTATLQSGAPDSAQGQTTGSHAFTWEARNQ
jgi:camelysin-like metallo-endopeptidase